MRLFVNDHGGIGCRYRWDNREHDHRPSAVGMAIRTWPADVAPISLRVTPDDHTLAGCLEEGYWIITAPNWPYEFCLLSYRETKRHLLSLWACVAALSAYKRSDEGTRRWYYELNYRREKAVNPGGEYAEWISQYDTNHDRNRPLIVKGETRVGKTTFCVQMFGDRSASASSSTFWAPGRSYGATRRW